MKKILLGLVGVGLLTLLGSFFFYKKESQDFSTEEKVSDTAQDRTESSGNIASTRSQEVSSSVDEKGTNLAKIEKNFVYTKEAIQEIRKNPDTVNPADAQCEGMILNILRDQKSLYESPDGAKTFNWDPACNDSQYRDITNRVMGFCKTKEDLTSSDDCLREVGNLKAMMVLDVTKDYRPEDFTNQELLKNRISAMVIWQNKPYSEVGPFVDRAIEISGDDPEILKMALITKGLAVAKKEYTPSDGELEKIDSMVQRSLDQKIVTTSDSFELYAATLLFQSKYDQALLAADKYEPYFSKDGITNYLRAAVYNKTGRRSEAISQLETAVKKSPTNKRYQQSLSKLKSVPEDQEIADAFTFNFALTYKQDTPEL
jgi:tetratricopeptide (TPR) repeat protein